MVTTGNSGFAVDPNELTNAVNNLAAAATHWSDIGKIISQYGPLEIETFSVVGILAGAWNRYFAATMFHEGMAAEGANTLSKAAVAVAILRNNYLKADDHNASNLRNVPNTPIPSQH